MWVERDPDAVNVAHHQVIARGTVELDQAELRPVPVDAVDRFGVADAHLAVLSDVVLGAGLGERAAVGAGLALRPRRVGRRHVDDERVVPTFKEAVGRVEDDVGVEIVVADLPGQVFAEERVLARLARAAGPDNEVLGLRPKGGVQQQVSVIDHVPVRPVSAMPRTIYFWPIKKIAIMGNDVKTVAAISSPGTGSPCAICHLRKASPIATV